MNQSLLYRVNLISINLVKNDSIISDILEKSYDISQIRLWKLFNGISYDDITEL